MTVHVLILCTHNSARSVLGEGMLNHLAARLGRDVRAHSAGSAPSGRINPFAIEALKNAGIDTRSYRSKSWDEFAAPGAPEFDFVFTVCDNAAGEACPVWYGAPVTAHWGIPDPAHVEGDVARRAAFNRAADQLARRIQLFLSLPIEKLDAIALKHELTNIGRIAD